METQKKCARKLKKNTKYNKSVIRNWMNLVCLGCFLVFFGFFFGYSGHLWFPSLGFFFGCFFGYSGHLWFPSLGFHEAETRATGTLKQELHIFFSSLFFHQTKSILKMQHNGRRKADPLYAFAFAFVLSSSFQILLPTL